ncbi:MAG: HAAS signaling domain-containing protein [Acidimicrobiales bacterium]
MTATLSTAPEVTRYLAQVREHLGGLAEEERAELLDDLQAHLAEMAAEPGPPLEERLGQPAAFAEELLASAGLAGATPAGPERRPLWAWVGDAALLRSVRDSAATRQVIAFLPELRPGWWVLRGYLAVMVLSAADHRPALDSFPFPHVGGTVFGGLVALAAAVTGSVWWARRVNAGGRRRRLTIGLNTTLLVIAVLAGSELRQRDVQPRYFPAYIQRPGALHSAGGRPITNVYPYDAEGQPLQGVRLYDQDGRPLSTGDENAEGRTDSTYPLDPRPLIDPDVPLTTGAPVTTVAPTVSPPPAAPAAPPPPTG